MSSMTRREWIQVAAVAPVVAAAASRVDAAPAEKDVKDVVAKAAKFLASKQKDNGDLAPNPRIGAGLTALAVSALIRNGRADDSVVAKGLAFLEKNVKPDGGIYSQGLENYTTCLALVTFKEANKDRKYDKVIEAAGKYLRGLQINTEEKDVKFGGVGYGGKGRPDLSNTHFMIEALMASGASQDDKAVKDALTFISNCQNLPGEFNKQEFAKKAGDADKGGFVYNPLEGDNPKSDKASATGGLRSEGGMTYAGLKSFLYAGVGKDDPRVKAAIEWIRKHYSVTENPGQGLAGLFYYYTTFAKAMDALGEDPFIDAKKVKHDWRKELFDQLEKTQKADGSWANSNAAFLENAPELATAFALLAISYTTPKK
jgi:squalene-hopene/tetraprenyl-beta-curcumene cyclase